MEKMYQSADDILEGVSEDAAIEEVFEEYDGAQEVFPGGPTYATIEEWKQLFDEVYSTVFGDDTYIWRCMTRSEYKEVLRVPKADAMYREEKICTKCVLWPLNYDVLVMAKGKAGVPAVLAEQIMERSGFVPSEEPRRL